MRNKRIAAAAGIGLAVVVATGGIAVAGAQGEAGDDGDVTVDGPQADRAIEAALDATGGGRANSVERDDENGATWEVEVTRTDGSTVDVRLDESFEVVVIEGDAEDAE